MIVKQEGASLPPLAETTYSAICSGYVDLGTQYSDLYKKQQHKLMIFWELPDTDEGNGPRILSREFSALLDEKAALREWLEIWRSRPFTAEELQGFDLNNIVNAGCYLGVKNKETNGKTYSNIAAILALPKGTKLGVAKTVIKFDLGTTPEENAKAFKNDLPLLPGWVQGKIKKSAEYAAFTSANPTLSEHMDFTPITDDELPF